MIDTICCLRFDNHSRALRVQNFKKLVGTRCADAKLVIERFQRSRCNMNWRLLSAIFDTPWLISENKRLALFLVSPHSTHSFARQTQGQNSLFMIKHSNASLIGFAVELHRRL